MAIDYDKDFPCELDRTDLGVYGQSIFMYIVGCCEIKII